MVFLTSHEILELCKGPSPLIDPLDPDQAERMEGGQYDLRVDSLSALDKMSYGHIGCSDRITPKIYPYPPHPFGDIAGNFGWTLWQDTYYLLKTVEQINMPDDLVGLVWPRTTVFRCGLLLSTAPVSPGYHGTLTFGLTRSGAQVTLQHSEEANPDKRTRIACIRFARLSDNESTLYDGVWQGGRMSTDGKTERPF